MATPIASQLLKAWKEHPENITLEELLTSARRHVPRSVVKDAERAGRNAPLACDFTSLSRKLHGKQGMSMAEAAAIAAALGCALDWSAEQQVKVS